LDAFVCYVFAVERMKFKTNLVFSKGAPYRNCTVQVLCFERGPQQQLKFEGTLLSKGPPTATEMCKYSAFKLIEGAPKRNCNV